MKSGTFTIRPATELDQLAITALVHGEHLNPIDLDWRRFMLATDRRDVVGAVQLRDHVDSRELGSLVVRKDFRGRGIASRLIDALLTPMAAPVFMITGAAFARHYERWGFHRIEPARAPTGIRRNYYFGQFVGGLMSLLRGRRPRELAILDRDAPAYWAAR